jgi:hypothetical protein
MRVEQPAGERGSLKWIQRAVAERWPELEQPLRQRARAAEITWRSPLESDSFAEYRDSSFLEAVGLSDLKSALASFWPQRGPQWDALGTFGERSVVLVEAKSHIREFCSPGTGASAGSRSLIEARLADCAKTIGAKPKAAWADTFYQLANRLAHLGFLRSQGIDAYLLLVGFLDDKAMGGPNSAETWDAAYLVAYYALGLPARHKLSPFIVHAHPRVPHG